MGSESSLLDLYGNDSAPVKFAPVISISRHAVKYLSPAEKQGVINLFRLAV